MAGEPLVLRGCRLVVPCARCEPLVGASVVVEDGVITHVGDGVPPGARSGKVIECGGLAVYPCFYNAHTHTAMVLVRGVFEGLGLREWLARVWAVEKALTPSVVYEASRAALAEMASTGTCGFLDMYFYPEATARAALEAGLRAALGPPIMGAVDAWRAVEAAARFAWLVESSDWKGLVTPVVNVHSVYAVPLDAVEAAAKLSVEEKLVFHIHASETRWETEWSRERYGLTPVRLLDRLGALHERSVLAHAGWLTGEEVWLAAERGATLVHCPASNMKLGSGGVFPLVEALGHGGRVAVGTDGAATNNTLDMMGEARLAALLQSYARLEPSGWALEVFEAATEGSAGAMGLRAGRLEPGFLGDMVVLRADRPWLDPERPVESLVYTAPSSDVEYTIVGGRVVYAANERDKLLGWAARTLSRLRERLAKTMADAADPEPPCSPAEACKARAG